MISNRTTTTLQLTPSFAIRTVANVKGTGSERRGFADGGSARSSSARRRPSTAPAAQEWWRESPSLTTYGFTCAAADNNNNSDTNKGASNGDSRRCWDAKPLALGPIPLNEGRKLRYPLLQLKREKARAKSVCGTRSVDDAKEGRARNSAREESYVDVPVARDWKGQWQPHLVRVPCRIEPNQG